MNAQTTAKSGGLKNKLLGEWLCGIGMISPFQLSDALSSQQESGQKLGQVLVQKGLLSEKDLQQVLALGLPASAGLDVGRRSIERDEALVKLAAAARLPQLSAIGIGSYTQVGTSVGLITNLPTLGDISLGLQQNGYAEIGRAHV